MGGGVRMAFIYFLLVGDCMEGGGGGGGGGGVTTFCQQIVSCF